MGECRYGKEPLDTRLFVLRLLGKIPVVLLAAIFGALLVGGPYFLVKVTFGPAKEYEAVSDFYIEYALQEDGTPYTYINYATWDQLLKDDVFTDKILAYMAGGEENAVETAGITKEELRGYLSADVLSDTRIATTTVRTNDPALTMRIERALVRAMLDFGEGQREIAQIRILQEPEEASLVVRDVRTFRACMVGAVSFVFVTLLYLCLYYALDEGIHIPVTFERRFGIPMLGTIRSKELPVLAERLSMKEPVLLTADEKVNLEQAEKALADLGIKVGESYRFEELCEAPGQDGPTGRVKELADRKVLLIVKAGAHNGKGIEKTLAFCEKCKITVGAALLWEADERLIRAYEMPEHVFHAGRRSRNAKGK